MKSYAMIGALLFASAALAQSGGLGGTTWAAENIAGGGVIDSSQTTVSFEDANAVSGSGGCNRYRGAVTVDGDNMQFGQIAATKKACAPALMDQETKFFAALDAARTFVIDGAYLLLRDQSGAEILRLTQIRN